MKMLRPFCHQFISIAEGLPRLVCVTTERCFQYPDARFYIMCMKIIGKNDTKWTVQWPVQMATNLLAGTVVPLTCVAALNSMHACLKA